MVVFENVIVNRVCEVIVDGILIFVFLFCKGEERIVEKECIGIYWM